jgi:cell division transport system permease protein
MQVTFYLRDGVDGAGLAGRLSADRAVESVAVVSREEALERFRRMFRDLRTLPEDVGGNPFPASVEATIRPGPEAPSEVARVAHAYADQAGIEEVQYDLLWVQRLTAGVRLVRGLGTFLGGVLVLAGVFTISNVIRLTIYARQDELDIMRLVGATPAYVKGPFVVEGMIQGGLGGAVAVVLLWATFGAFVERALASPGLLARADVFLPPGIGAGLVLGGMAAGVAGSLVSLGRLKV